MTKAAADSKEAIHAHNAPDLGGEFTVCGMSFDAFQTGDADHPVVMAEPGEIVTCEHCRRIITFMKTFKRWKQP